MKTLNISSNLKLPLEAVTQTFAWLAKRRVGKTYAASVLAEEFVAAGLPFVALDPTGAWWGLRASADGRGAGLPVVVIGGRHGDIPLNPEDGKLIADVVVDNPGYYVLDLSLTKSNAEQDRFAADFAERLYRRKQEKRDPMFLFVDEADAFCPQRPYPGQQRMLGAFEALVRRGGIYGIGVGLISQRASVINKNVLTQTEVMVVLQTTSPQDRAAIKEWALGHGTKEQVEQLMETVASLQKGEAWVWSPSWLEIFKRVNIRARHTFNSSATPKVGERQIEPKRMAEVDIAALKEKLSKTIEAAKENDPATLKRLVSALKQELVSKNSMISKTALTPKVAPAPKVKIVKVPLLKDSQVKRLEGLAEKAAWAAGELAIAVSEAKKILLANTNLQSVVTGMEKKPTVENYGNVKVRPMFDRDMIKIDPKIPPGEVRFVAPNGDTVGRIVNIGSGNSGQNRMLEVIARRSPNRLTRTQVATLSGLSPTSGTFTTYLSRLVRGGLIDQAGTTLGLTAAGAEVGKQWLGHAQDRGEVLSLWQKSLGGTEWKMLERLLSLPSDTWTTREIVAQSLNLSPVSGTFTTYLSRLRRNGLIQENGRELRAVVELHESIPVPM